MELKLPRCNICDAYYIPSDLDCPNCNQNNQMIPLDIKTDQVRKLKEVLFGPEEILRQIPSAGMITPIPEYGNNPPPPPVPRTKIHEDLNLINIPDNELHDISRYLVYRIPLLIFDNSILTQLLQYPWTDRRGSELIVEIKRNTSENTAFPLKLILKFGFYYFAGLESLSYDVFIQDLSIEDEIGLHLASTYLVLTNTSLPSKIIHFLANSNTKNQRFPISIFVLGENQSHPIITSSPLIEAEKLLVNLARSVLNVPVDSELIFSIAKSGEILEQDNFLFYPDNKALISTISNLTIEKSTTTICIAHGGIIQENSESFQCQSCEYYICLFCKDHFVICPGSFATKIHGF